MMFTSRIRQLRSGFSGRAHGHGNHAKARAGCGLAQKRRYQPPVEVLEQRCLLAVNLLSSFTGMNQLAAAGPNNNPGFVTIYSPPDTTGAAGPTEYVEAANMGIRISNKTTGTAIATDSVHDFMFTQGGLTQVMPIPGPPANAPDYLNDVTMVWDNLVQRFIIGVQDVNGSASSTFDVAASKSASPLTLTAADWNFYQVNTTESGLTPDYPGNMGYNADAFVFTLNENGTNGHVLVVSMKISDMIAGNPTTPFLNDVSGFSLRPTEMHDSKPGDPMWLLESQTGGGSSISVLLMANVLSNSPTITTTNVTVNSYSGVVQPKQPNGTGLAPSSGNGALWTHILKAAEYNNTIVACDQVSVSSTEDDARWYAIDVSGTPTIKASVGQGNVSAGNNTYIVFPSIDINSKGDIGMTYLFSGTGAGQFMSMYVVGRAAGDAAGTMQAPVLVQAGAANSTDGREGDLSGSSVDSTPLTVTAAANQSAVEGALKLFSLGSFTDSEGNFWAANEWATLGTTSNPWSTAIGQFALSTKGPWSVDVDWGDSGPHDTFSVTTADGLGTRSHTYGEEGTKTVTVKVTDTSDNHSDSKTFTVNVDDPAVVQASAVPVSAVEGTLFSGAVGTFTDPGGAEPNLSDPTDGIASHYKVVSIDWGDSTPLDTSGSISFGGAQGSKTDPFTVSGSHTYGEEGTYTITAIIDHEGVTTTVTSTATVSDPAVVQASAVPVSAVEGAAFTGTAFATFTDPGGAEPNPSDPTDGIASHYTVVSIDWGDSTPLDTTTGAISFSGAQGSTTDPFTVAGSHTYGEEGPYTIHVVIDHEGVKTTLTGTATVSDPKVVASGVPVFAVACKPLSGVTLATFTDPGGAEPNPSDPTDGIASHYKVVSIDWGDSTPLDTTTGAISFSGTPGSKTDPFTVSGNHTYATEGTHTITAIIDHEGVTTTVTTTVTIKDQLGLLLLDPSGRQSLMVTGAGHVTVTGTGNCGAVVVNSKACNAVSVTGIGVVAAGDFDVTGGVFTAGLGVVPSPVDHEAPTPDPLLGLALPSPLPPKPVGNTATALHPGTYFGGLHFSGKTAVTLAPGVYVMKGGGFSVSGLASVTGSNVVIINIPVCPFDRISVSGLGVLILSAPTSGPYQGVAVFQASCNPVAFSCLASVRIAGVVYTPAAPVCITDFAVVTINHGAGTATLPSIDAAMIAYDLEVDLIGALTINADPPSDSSSSMASAASDGGGAADVHSAALAALTSGGSLSGSSTLADQEAMNEVAMSLAGNADLFSSAIGAAKKKTS